MDKPIAFNYKDHIKALDEISSLKIEIARLKNENTNLQIRCRIAETKVNELQDGKKVNDLISRADAIEAVCGNCLGGHYTKCNQKEWCEDIKSLFALPSDDAVSREDGIPCPICNGKGVIKRSLDVNANVVEVVRCKDCEYRNWETKGCNANPCVEEWQENDFCSRAKMKGGAE